ncbi:hypothetical protein [Pseudomonas peli]|uniref:hypothetical protein n=1 Tax=Pseudomonas peli TaxID=592361 RepID=UPI003D312547
MALLRRRERSRQKAIKLKVLAQKKNKELALIRLRERERKKVSLLKAAEKRGKERAVQLEKAVKLKALKLENNKKLALTRLRERERKKVSLLKAAEKRRKERAVQLEKAVKLKALKLENNKKLALTRLRERERNTASLLKAAEKRRKERAVQLEKAVKLKALKLENNKKLALTRLRERERNKASLLKVAEKKRMVRVVLLRLCEWSKDQVVKLKVLVLKKNKIRVLPLLAATSKIRGEMANLFSLHKQSNDKPIVRRIFSICQKNEYCISNISLQEFCLPFHEPTLIFVESNSCVGRYRDLSRVLAAENIFLIFRSKSDYLSFIGSCDYALACAGVRVLFVDGIDSELDEAIYCGADEAADEFLKLLIANFEGSEFFSRFSKYLPALRVSISDRLVVWVRGYLFLKSFILSRGISQFYVLPNRLASSRLLLPALDSTSFLDSGFLSFDDVPAEAEVNIEDIISGSFRKFKGTKVTRYDFDSLSNLDQEVCLLAGNLKASQYREAAVPIVNSLASCGRKVIVLSPYADTSDCVFENDNVIVVSPEASADLDVEILAFNELFDRAIDDVSCNFSFACSDSPLFSAYLFLSSRAALHRLLRDSYCLMRDLDSSVFVHRVRSLVSLPGRLPISQFLVMYFESVSSFEVQSGPWSRSKRFKAPLSRYVLANDSFSRGIFVDYLGVESSRVLVVGSPRIDYKLSSIRGVGKAESRSVLFPSSLNSRVLCVATQPYNLLLMEGMVSEVAKFVASSNGGWVVAVSMHPNESHSHECAYREVLSELILEGKAFIGRGDIYNNINASDAVVTYFSTTGMEAFCLGRPVYTYRSSGYDVPFDLSELGVATVFSSSLDLKAGIDEGGGRLSVGELGFLKDGNSVMRIRDCILRGHI